MQVNAKQALHESISNYIDYICECHDEPIVDDAPVIKWEKDSIALVEDVRKEKREHFIALILDSQNRVLKKQDVSIGTTNASLVHPREVFREAIKLNGTGIICLHNHPSGTLDPSTEDLTTTKRLKEAGELLGIKLYDHIIVTSQDYRSILSTPDWHLFNNR